MINPKVRTVVAQDDYTLYLTFENDEERILDMTSYLDKDVFRELQEKSYFRRVKVSSGSVEWPNEQDLSYNTLYLESIPLSEYSPQV